MKVGFDTLHKAETLRHTFESGEGLVGKVFQAQKVLKNALQYNSQSLQEFVVFTYHLPYGFSQWMSGVAMLSIYGEVARKREYFENHALFMSKIFAGSFEVMYLLDGRRL